LTFVIFSPFYSEQDNVIVELRQDHYDERN